MVERGGEAAEAELGWAWSEEEAGDGGGEEPDQLAAATAAHLSLFSSEHSDRRRGY